MRSVWAVLLVLLAPVLLLSPLSQSQDADSSTAEEDRLRRLGLPVQTVVDAVPRVVSLAIEEARFDGTPGQAEALVDQMRAFTADFKYGYNPIDGSEVAGVDLNAALRFSIELVDVVEAIVPRIADVEVVSARCASWGANVTGPEFESWQERFRTGRAASEGALLALQARAEDLPVIVDPAPIDRAVRLLQDWIGDDVVVIQTCMTDLEAELVERGLLEAPAGDVGVRFLRVVPGRQYVTGNVTIIGALGVHEEATVVRVRAAGLGLDRVMDLVDGRRVFALRYEVPLATVLGTHTINATLPHGAGNETNLSVEKASSRLVMRYPTRMYLDRADRFEVRLESPVRAVTDRATLNMTGDLGRELQLADGRAAFDYQAPGEEVLWRGNLEYAGHRVVDPTSRPYRIDVVVAPPPRQYGFFDFDGDVVVWAWAVPGALLVLVGVDALLRKRRSRRRTFAPEAAADGPVDPLSLMVAALRADRGVVWLYGLYHRFLLLVGRAVPRDTVRTIEDRQGEGARLGRMVEGARYGRGPAPHAGDREAQREVVRRWREGLRDDQASGR